MERKFPKNVRQVGNVCDTPKIYVEDYVDTYLAQLRDKASDMPVGALLMGESLSIEGQECVCITGAVQIKEVEENAGEIKILPGILEEAKEECKTYFPEKDIVGWFLIAPGRPMTLSGSMVKIHEQIFTKKNSIFILKHAEEDEEIYFAYKYHELMQMGGYYIFYEKNPEMQNYMINTRRQIGVTPSEVVEDRAAKNFRSAIKEKMEVQEQKNNSKLVYLTSALLVVVVLAIGISTMNNYDKMNSVQSSIETLSKSVQGSGEEERQTEAGADAKAADDPDSEEVAAQGDSGQEEEASSDIQPPISTIQEELSEEDYYTVQRGDTLDKISLKLYGTTEEAEAICKMNGLTDGNLIFIGQKLLLP